jgi:hypothetical protein
MTVHGTYKGVVREDLGYLNTGGRPHDALFAKANLPRLALEDLAAPLATGVMTAVQLWLTAGDVITSLSWVSGSTAAGTPTNYWTALYSDAAVPALLGQSADQLTAAWAADTWKTLALASPITVPKSGKYWAAINVTATTPPTLMGMQAAKPVLAGETNLAVTSGTGLTGTATATLAAPAWTRKVPLVVAS